MNEISLEIFVFVRADGLGSPASNRKLQELNRETKLQYSLTGIVNVGESVEMCLGTWEVHSPHKEVVAENQALKPQDFGDGS